MKKRIWIIVLLLFGVIGSVSLYFLFNVNKVEVLVAAQTIRGNTEIKSTMISTAKMEKESLPKNYIEAKYAEDVVGRYTDIGVTEGAVLTTDNVATGDGSRTSVIPKGYTVMTLSLESLPSGIKAGDYVNILVGTTSTSQGKVVMTYQKISVTDVIQDSDGNATGIEIQVTPAQAQKIEYAQLNGNISVSLLSGDYKKQSLNAVDESKFMKTDD